VAKFNNKVVIKIKYIETETSVCFTSQAELR